MLRGHAGFNSECPIETEIKIERKSSSAAQRQYIGLNYEKFGLVIVYSSRENGKVHTIYPKQPTLIE